MITLYDEAGQPKTIFTNLVGEPPEGALALEYCHGTLGCWITDEDELAEAQAGGAELLYFPQVDRI